MMLAPWVLVPMVRALDSPDEDGARPLWQEAARSAIAVALMGAVNAVATVAATSVAGLWLLGALLAARGDLRRRLVFTAWWAASLAGACLWWLVPLLLLSRVSPPFLDYIESARVTTEWTSLTEVLRGTTSWTPFVSSERAAGAVLVAEPAAVLATGVVALAGLAGLTMRRMPYRRRLLAILVAGFLLLCLGYPGALGSPLAEQVRVFLDGPGAPLRNLHKFDPLIRLPLALGIAHLLAQLPAWVGQLRRREHASAATQRAVATALVVAAAILGSGSLLWTGGVAPASSYRGIPGYWQQTADWLTQRHSGTGAPARALVVPGAPFAEQLWGLTRDEPLQPLATTPWAVRDAIPLTPPGAIRALDAVQRDLTAGRGSAALAPVLADLGIGYVVLRADLDPAQSRSARPLVVGQALRDSPGIDLAAEFGPLVAPPTVAGVVVDEGLRPELPAVQIFAVGDARTTGPMLVDADEVPRVDGAPESLLAVSRARMRAGQPPLGPALLTADAQRAGLPADPRIVTDTPADREVDFGRVDDNYSAIRAPGDPRLTKNRVATYGVNGQPLVEGQWLLDNQPGRVSVRTTGSAADATAPGRSVPAASAASAFDGNPDTAWVSSGLSSALGRSLTIDFTEPMTGLAVTVTTAPAIGADVSSVLVTTDSGSTVATGLEPGVATRIVAPGGSTRSLEIRAIDTADGSRGNQFALAEVEVSDADSGAVHAIRHRVVLPELPDDATVEQWVLHQELGGRDACVTDADGRAHCSAALELSPEAPGVFARTLSVPAGMASAGAGQAGAGEAGVGEVSAEATILLRPAPGGALTSLLHQPGTVLAEGPSSTSDPRGAAAAVADGDPDTVWTAPIPRTDERDDDEAKPTLTLTLPAESTVDGLALTLPDAYPAAPTRLRVDLGDGPQEVQVPGDGRVALAPHRTSSVEVTVLETVDSIDVNDLGFASPSPAGIAGIEVLGDTSFPAPDPDRRIVVPCDSDAAGPYGLGIGARGQLLRMSVDTTARALLSGEPVVARVCPAAGAAPRAPALLPLGTGETEVLVNPGEAFSVDSVLLTPAGAAAAAAPDVVYPDTPRWDVTERSVTVPAAERERLLVVPESTNPGWTARLDGHDLAPVVVGGWQQGWVIPAGAAGTVTLTFGLDVGYRWALVGGAVVLAALFVAGLWPRTRRPSDAAAPRAAPPTWPAGLATVTAAGAAGLGAAWLLAGWAGVGIAAATGFATWFLPPRARVAMVVATGAVGVVALASAPWHAGAPYAGYDALPQAAILVALSLTVTSSLLRPRTQTRTQTS